MKTRLLMMLFLTRMGHMKICLGVFGNVITNIVQITRLLRCQPDTIITDKSKQKQTGINVEVISGIRLHVVKGI